ncbi:hypothetical protein Scep_010258 [Stephania cephalantha]|uniref:Uncharacterized protein n=1 Tax=Stephania cephalantha TaxID=152367 RepID=A0AAP0JUS4_9MAGN
MKQKLQKAEHSIKKLNSGKAKLDKILSIGQSPVDHVGLSYKGKNSGGSISTTFMKASSSTDHSKNNVKADGSTVKLKSNSSLLLIQFYWLDSTIIVSDYCTIPVARFLEDCW